MSNHLTVEVISLEKLITTATAEEVLLPGSEGQLGIRPGHIPLITPLQAGEVVIKKVGQSEEVLAVFGGFAEVYEDCIRIMIDSAEFAADLNEEKIKAAIEKAKKEHLPSLEGQELEGALSELSANVARLKALRRYHVSHHRHPRQED